MLASDQPTSPDPPGPPDPPPGPPEPPRTHQLLRDNRILNYVFLVFYCEGEVAADITSCVVLGHFNCDEWDRLGQTGTSQLFKKRLHEQMMFYVKKCRGRFKMSNFLFTST